MLGAIAGDIIGSVHEFSQNERSDFPLFVKRSSPTDDSLLTAAIARACLQGSRDYRAAILQSWEDSRRPAEFPPLGPTWGTGFSAWASTGGATVRESFGNGAAMRVSPVAWAYEREADVLEHARLTAADSHAHPEGIKGAVATAHCTWVARRTKDAAAVRRTAEQYYPQLPTLEAIRRTHTYNETCQGCVPECLAIAVGTPDFVSAIRFACSIRGDADTLAAIAGSVSQALHGIPEHVRQPTVRLAHRYYPWIGATVAEFEARFGTS